MALFVLRLWRANTVLRETVEMRAQMADHADCGLILFDAQGVCQAANRQACIFLPFMGISSNDSSKSDTGRKGGNGVGRYGFKGTAPLLGDILNYLHDHAVECDQSLKNTIDRSSGKTDAEEGFREVVRWGDTGLCLVEARKSESGGTVFLLSDVSAAKQHEDSVIRLHKFNYELIQAVEAATSGIMVTNPKAPGHLVVFVNKTFCDLVGVEKEGITGRGIEILYRKLGKTEYRHKIEAAFTQARSEELEVRFDETGQKRWFDLKLSPVFDSRGRLDLFIGIFTETTALKLREAEFSKAQKLEALGQIAGGVAHDFNNVLSIIMGYAQMARNHLNEPETLESYLEKILTASKRGAGLTKKMLTFSRHKMVEDTVIDLAETVRQQEVLLNPLLDASIDFSITTEGDALFVEGTEDNMAQILMNLCMNARDAMKEGGTLRVDIRKADFAEAGENIHENLGDAGPHVCLSVSDTGSGMDKMTRDKIFDPFFSTKEQGKGTGLGMSVVYGLVRQMKGSIDVRSAAGQGTTVFIYLPLSDKPPSKLLAGDPSDAKSISLKGYTALVAEDEPDLLLLVATFLENLGMSVIRAADGDQALVEQDNFTDEIDLLLTDVVMPGLNGVRLAELVESLRPGIRTIFMSGYPAHGDMARVELPKDARFIAKPVQYEALAPLIYAALKEGKTHDSGQDSDLALPHWKTG
ncbi:MAG: response regulator [Alphaproteobacteria bacterium]|nr:response regulator [Alphaproteobacteria bacterium]